MLQDIYSLTQHLQNYVSAGRPALKRMQDRMLNNVTGQQILLRKPRITVSHIEAVCCEHRYY